MDAQLRVNDEEELNEMPPGFDPRLNSRKPPPF